MALLEIKGLKTHFKTDDGWLHAVDGVDISIEAGQTVCVVGESGCGKSVTAKTVMKLIDMPPGKIVAGQVLWQGRDLVPLPAAQMQKIRAKEIAMIFQEPMTSLNPVYPWASRSPKACACTKACRAATRWTARWRCCAWSRSPLPSAACATTRTSSAAACASA
jgi:ABC-type glutathione transport system ATPase component